MTEEDRKKLEYIVSEAYYIGDASGGWLKRRGCEGCIYANSSWSKYPEHVLMEILMDPDRLNFVGCSRRKEVKHEQEYD